MEVPQDNGGSRDGSGGAIEKPMEAQNEGAQGDELKIADEEPGQFAGLKVRRRAALAGNCKGDYVGVSYDPFLDKILRKQGKPQCPMVSCPISFSLIDVPLKCSTTICRFFNMILQFWKDLFLK